MLISLIDWQTDPSIPCALYSAIPDHRAIVFICLFLVSICESSCVSFGGWTLLRFIYFDVFYVYLFHLLVICFKVLVNGINSLSLGMLIIQILCILLVFVILQKNAELQRTYVSGLQKKVKYVSGSIAGHDRYCSI